MFGNNVGSIEYDARINLKQYDKDSDTLKKKADSTGKSLEDSADRSDRAWSKAAKVGIAAAIAGLVTLAGAGVKAANASWDQVAAVQQATVGLKAYEKNGDAVNGVLQDLIKYARSDMGVLFNRRDLFQSAQMLKLNGVETADLSKNVQILSRSVGLGLGNWQDLNAVVGRVVATGRLSGIEFDQLTQYGFRLDKTLRNTNITTQDFFKTLDKGIPVDALAGQATTIRGLGIRIESAFRGIGDAILGVDADTSTFIKGGLGDLIVQFMNVLPSALKSVQPIVQTTFTSIIAAGTNLVTVLGQKFSEISQMAQGVFGNIRQGEFQKLGEKIGDGIGSAISGAFTALNISTDSLVTTFSKIDWPKLGLEVGKQAVGFLLGLVTGILNTDTDPIIKFFTDNWAAVLIGAFSIALAPAKLIGPLTKVIGKIPIIGPLTNWVINGVRGAFGPIRDAFGYLFNGTKSAFGVAFSRIGTVFSTMKNILLAPFRILIDNIALQIKLIPTTIANTFNAAVNIVRMISSGFVTAVRATFSLIVDVIRTILQPLTNFFKSILDGFVAAANFSLSSVGSFFSQLYLRIILSLQGIPTFFVNIFGRAWQAVTSIFSTVSQFFGGVFGAGVNAIRNVFSSIIGFFQGLWGAIVRMFGNVGTAIGNAIGGAFRNVINSILRQAVGIINGFIDAINGAVSTINKVPGVNISTIGRLGVPQLATGGIVSSPTLAMIGEGRESEAVIPLSKLDDMLSGDGGKRIENNIQTIIVNDRSDADYILQRLTDESEVIENGSTPRRRYA